MMKQPGCTTFQIDYNRTEMRLKRSLLLLLPVLLNAQELPHPMPHPEPNVAGELRPEEKSEGKEVFQGQFKGNVKIRTQEETARDDAFASAVGRNPAAEAAHLQATFQHDLYRHRAPSDVTAQLTAQYSAEQETSRREALRTEIKFVQHADWDFQIRVEKNGGLKSWLWTENAAKIRRPERNAPRGAQIYIEDHVNLAAVDAGASVVPAVNMAVSQGTLHAYSLQNKKAVSASPDYIYDESTKSTFRRITKDAFDPDKESGSGNTCSPPSTAPECAVFLVMR